MRSRPRDGGLVRITGYIFRADTYCPSCIGQPVADSLGYVPEGEGLNRWQVEEMLDTLAETLGVDRQNESSFDSDDFPKVVLSVDDDGITCGRCGNPFE